MENEEKIDIESTLKNLLFFQSVKDGIFDYSTPLKSSISNFNSDKTKEPSQSLFEYICYKEIKKLISEKNKIDNNTLIITEQFLISKNSKEIIKKNTNNKKNIIICIQNIQTLKWNIIAFLNIEEQMKSYFDKNKKNLLKVKIISSNTNSDEDDYILNDIMDKIENNFDFKIPEDIQFEVDSFNINDQPSTAIFIINFIKQLIIQDESKIPEFIQKLYDEGSNNTNSENKVLFNSFNDISEEMKNIYETYNNELNEYLKNNKININTLEEKEKLNDNLDDDLNSDEEEEALKIMERENEEAKHLMRQKERKLRQKLYKQKLKEKNMIMYKEFGVIKEEDNESESESIDFFGKMKEKEEERIKYKENKNNKNSSKNNQILNNLNVNININVNNSHNIDEIKNNFFNTENNIQTKNQSKSEKNIKLSVLKELEEAIQEFELEQEPIKITEDNIKIKKEEIKNNSKELNEKPKNNEENEKNSEKKIEKKIENKKEKKTSPRNSKAKKKPKLKEKEKEEIKKDDINNNDKEKENEQDKKKINKGSNNNFNINIFKNENIEFKKRASVPKSQIKVKKLQLDFKYPNNKTTEKLKKSFTNTKHPENRDVLKEKLEKEKEDELSKTNYNNSLLSKKKSMPLKETIIDSSNSSSMIKQLNSKDTEQISIKIKINNNSYKSLNINNSKINEKEEDKTPKLLNKEKDNLTNIPLEKEPRDNLSRKITDLNNIIKTKNSSKKNSNIISKKSNHKIIKANSEYQTPSYTTKKSTSSSNKSEETNSIHNEKEKEKKIIKNKVKAYMNKKETTEEKLTLNISSTDNPINLLPPPKLVERNALLDFSNKKNEKEKSEGDYSSNINIENINNDFSERDKKSEISEGSYIGRERTRKSKVNRNDKTYPPGKIRNSKRFNEYGKLDQEDANKICGCIGEQASGFCEIF